VKQYRRQIDNLLSQYKLASEQVGVERIALRLTKTKIVHTKEAQKIVQQVAATIQSEAHKRIASVVSRCLKAVFDRPYRFKITFEKRRGKTDAVLSFCRGEVEVDPSTAAGGSVVDVAGFALRVACLILARPKLRPLLVLDEPFKHLDELNQMRVRSMLEVLSDEMKIQFILVTHSQNLEAGKVVKIQ